MGHNEFGDPFAGEVRLFAGTGTPPGWMTCDGRQLRRSEYRDLFDAIGTTYGGSGDSFALPDLRGRVPLHVGPSKPLGSTGGQEKVALTLDEMGPHAHPVFGSRKDADSKDPAGRVAATIGQQGSNAVYGTGKPYRGLHPWTMSPVGEGHGHENLAPSVCLNFIIAFDGHSPSEPQPDPRTHSASALLGEVRMFGLNYAPHDFAPCDGDVRQISRETALYRVLGDRFGGSGGNFLLPNLVARVPMHAGAGPGLTPRSVGDAVGTDKARVSVDQLPQHSHGLGATGELATERGPENQAFALADGVNLYAEAGGETTEMAPEATGGIGAARPHENVQPYQAVGFVIAIRGVYPYPT